MTDNKYFSESEWMARYIKNPNFCPYCEGTDIYSNNGLESENDFAWRELTCLNCNKYWTEVFSLTAIEEPERYRI